MNKLLDYLLAYVLVLVAVFSTWWVAYAMYLSWRHA